MSMMAGQDRSVQVNLDANVTGYQRAMASAGAATNTLASGIGKLARATDDLIKKAGHIQIGIASADIASLSAAAAVYNRLDTSMAQMRATSAITGQSVGALRTQVISLSKSIPDSTNNIARLMGQVQALGIQGTQNIRNFTETAERLGAATDTPPGQLLQGIVQMNREMGNGLSTVNNYSSALVELSKQNGVSAGEILGFSQSIQSVAQQAGYTETQIMGLATAFTRAGADSAAAANVFVTLTSEINQAIVSNSAQLNQFASLVGMTRDQFRSLAQSHPEQAFTKVLEAIQTQGQRGILTLQQLGLDGPRALRVIAALTSGQANMAQSMNQASNAYSKNQALTKASNAAWADFASTMTQLRNELTQLAVQFGGPMAHVLDIFFKGVTKVLGGLNSFLGMLGPIPGIVAMIGGAFLAVTGTITTFSVALLAAAGAWRALSGMTGSNILQGFFSGRRAEQGLAGEEALNAAQTVVRGRPINMQRRTPSARWWYQQSFAAGQRTSAPPTPYEDQNMFQRTMGRVGFRPAAPDQRAGLMRSIALFGPRKFRAETREAANTIFGRRPVYYDPSGNPVGEDEAISHTTALGGVRLNRGYSRRFSYDPRALADYTRRDAGAVNPYSMLGLMQQAQSAGTSIHRGIMGAGGRFADLVPPGLKDFASTWRVKADSTEAQAKVEALRAEGAKPIITPLEFVQKGPGAGRVGGIGTLEEMLNSGGVSSTVREAEAGAGGLSKVLGAARGGFGAVTGALGTMAGVVGDVVMPLGLLAAVGVPLVTEFRHLVNAGRDAANNLDDVGAGLAQASGGTYTKPTGTGVQPPAPQDQRRPFSSNERSVALSGSFAATSDTTIQRFGDFRKAPMASRAAVAQQAINEVVANSNNGQPLSQSQRQTLREQLIAAYNGDTAAAHAVYNRLNLSGQSGAAAGRTTALIAGGTSNDAGFFQRAFTGTRSARQLRTAVEPIANALMQPGGFGTAGIGLIGLAQGTNMTNGAGRRYQNARDLYAQYGTMLANHQGLTTDQYRQYQQAQTIVGRGEPAGTSKFQVAVQSILDQYNKGKPSEQQVRGVDTSGIYSLQDFLRALSSHGDAGRRLAEGLRDAGLNADDLSGSLKRLDGAVKDSTQSQQTAAIHRTAIGGMANRMGLNLADPQDIGYQTNLNLLTQLSMLPRGERQNFPNAPGAMAASLTDTSAIRKAINAWTDYRNSLPGPDDPAYQGVSQMIDSLNQKLMAQNSIFQTGYQQAGTFASEATHILNTATPETLAGAGGAQAQQYLDQAGSAITQSEGQLMNYMTQVHNAHIQSQYEEHDHNLQMSRMWRDYTIQQREALYERNKQLEEANYQFNDQLRTMRFATATAFGNPAQFVQSQVTASAESALVGMQHQNSLLQQSRSTLDQLHQMGLSRNAIRLLGLDDPQNVEQAERYLQDFGKNPRLIAAFNQSIKGRLSIAQGLNTDRNNSKYADMRRQFDHTAQLATDAFNHSQQQTSDAFHRSLDDFNTDYQTSVTRQQDELNRLGEQIFHNFGQLNRAAMRSGLANIETFASGIIRQIGRVERVQSRLIQEGIDAVNNTGRNGGAGGSAGGGSVDMGVTAQGSQRGGGYGNAGVGKGGGGTYDVLANGKRVLMPGTGSAGTNYIAPGTGSVYTGGYRANYGPGGNDYRPSADFITKHPADPNFNKSIARRMAPGWARNTVEWNDLVNLWNNESGWNQYADNASSDAYGIPQSLPGTKMATTGGDWRTNPATQIAWGLNYIRGRYGSPSNAWAHEEQYNWYQKGGIFGSPQTIGVGEAGPEAVIPLNAMGSSFVSRVVEQAVRNSGITRSLVGLTHTMPHASVVFNAPITNHSDYSTNFTGPVTVQSQDPNEMARKLEQRQRLSALTRPIARR